MSRAADIIKKSNPKYEEKLSNNDWFTQLGRDYVAYGVVIDARANGKTQAVVFMSIGGRSSGSAKKIFIQNMHPEPKKIDKKEVPQKIMKKIEDVAGV